MDRVRALVSHAPAPVTARPLRMEERPRPVPGPGRVLVRVMACGVCRTDIHVVEGDLERVRSPVIPGHQIVGEVADLGPDARSPAPPGSLVGVAWLHETCGACRFCAEGRENLCERAAFTGWTRDGGFAEYVVAPADFVYAIPDAFGPVEAAPLLCAGIIGHRSLRLTGIDEGKWQGARLGIYGFGAAGHLAIQVARARGARVFVCTRDSARHQDLARELGAEWAGAAGDPPPGGLDAAILFAPAGELVPPALRALDPGGVLVLGGIHMSPIPSLDYRLLYRERTIRSVTNNTRADGREFLAEAARIGLRTHVRTFPLDSANEALAAQKGDAIRGAAVLVP